MESFFEYYCEKIKEYPPSSNKKGYLTRMLVNYLNGEYQASHAHLHAGLKNLSNSHNGFSKSVNDYERRKNDELYKNYYNIY